VQLGDRIDVHPLSNLVDQPLGSPPKAEGTQAATEPGNFVVVAISEQAISVATPTAQVQQLVNLLRAGPVLLALHGR
jgi:hypothetical protein